MDQVIQCLHAGLTIQIATPGQIAKRRLIGEQLPLPRESTVQPFEHLPETQHLRGAHATRHGATQLQAIIVPVAQQIGHLLLELFQTSQCLTQFACGLLGMASRHPSHGLEAICAAHARPTSVAVPMPAVTTSAGRTAANALRLSEKDTASRKSCRKKACNRGHSAIASSIAASLPRW